MNPQLAKAISVLALCLMDRTWDCCEFMRNVSESWRTDLCASLRFDGRLDKLRSHTRVVRQSFRDHARCSVCLARCTTVSSWRPSSGLMA
jgi:hypothetical protein